MSIASEALRNAYALLNKPRDFAAGAFITWKDHCMKNAYLPKDCNSFAIVVRFEGPTRGSDSVDNNQYSDFKDMVIGVIDEDGDYSEFTAASRRMKKFVE